MHGMGCQRPQPVCIGSMPPIVSSPLLRDDGLSSDEEIDEVDTTNSVRDLVRAINQKCSKMGSTCPRNTTVDAIRPSGTKPWNSKIYYPDHVPVVFPSIFPQKECLKRGELTISKYKEMNTRAQSVRELVQSFNQQCSNAATTSQMSLTAMTCGKYSSSSTLGNDQLATHASACVEKMVDSSAYISRDKNKNPSSSILPRLHASMSHGRMKTWSCISGIGNMASQVNLQCLTAAAATTTDARSMGRTAMATEDRVADPCLFSTMSENNLLSPTNKCIVTGEQQPWTPSSTPFQRYSHEVRNPMQQAPAEQPSPPKLNCVENQRSLLTRKVERQHAVVLTTTTTSDYTKLDNDCEQHIAGHLERMNGFRGKQQSSFQRNRDEELEPPVSNHSLYPISSSVTLNSQEQSPAGHSPSTIISRKSKQQQHLLGKPPTSTITTSMGESQRSLLNRKEIYTMVTNGSRSPITPEKLNDQELKFRAESANALKELGATIWMVEEGGEWKIICSPPGLALPAHEERFDNICSAAMKTLVKLMRQECLEQLNSEDNVQEEAAATATCSLGVEMEELREFVIACAKAGVFWGCVPCNWVPCCKKILNVYRRSPIEWEAKRLKAQALHFVRRNDLKKAIEYYTRAITISRDGPKAHVYLLHRATLYCRTRSFEAGMHDCNAAIALCPEFSQAYSQLGFIYSFTGKYQEAVDAYKEAARLDPDNIAYGQLIRAAMVRLDLPLLQGGDQGRE